MSNGDLNGSTRRLVLSAKVYGPPAEIQVIPFGRHETANGPFVLDGDGVRDIIRDFESRQNEMVIDYEHQSLGSGEAPAAGWITRLVNRGEDGLWAVVEWTRRARRYLEGREYRYLSPVFLKEADTGRVVRFLNAALTNTPAIDGMVPAIREELKGQLTAFRTNEQLLEAQRLEQRTHFDLACVLVRR